MLSVFCGCMSVLLTVLAGEKVATPVAEGRSPLPVTSPSDEKRSKRDELRAQLRKLPYKIVFESYRDGNWDIWSMRADGSKPANLTKSDKVDEMYPHASPDGAHILFVRDSGKGRSRKRNICLMEADGSGTKLVAANARQPCWSPTGKQIAYMKSEYERFTTSSYGTAGLFFCHLASNRHRQHRDRTIEHISYLCWSPDERWIFATVHGGMGYGHAGLAIETRTERIREMDSIYGCRMDVSPDGKRILWNAEDQAIAVADLDLKASPPKVTNARIVLDCDWTEKMYHGDWSPCGKYIAFSYGPGWGSQHVGEPADDWKICVADPEERNLWVSLATGGKGNKEPDWVPFRRGTPKAPKVPKTAKKPKAAKTIGAGK